MVLHRKIEKKNADMVFLIRQRHLQANKQLYIVQNMLSFIT